MTDTQIAWAFAAFIGLCALISGLRDNNNSNYSPRQSVRSAESQEILNAKDYVRSQLNYPDTANFRDMSTRVMDNHIILTVTAENAFGTPETKVFTVPRQNK